MKHPACQLSRALKQWSFWTFLVLIGFSLSDVCAEEKGDPSQTNKLRDIPSDNRGERSNKLVVPLARNCITGETLLKALRGGGYIIFFRHFNTDTTKWLEDPIKSAHGEMSVADFKNSGAQQRHLTDFGRKRARDVGEIIRKLQIPIGKVESSPYIRAIDAATLLAGRAPDDTPYELVYRGGALSAAAMSKNLIPYLSTKPGAGTNTLIVAHKSQMDDVRFIEEGEAFVFEPLDNGQFNLIATIYATDWFEALFDVTYLGLRGRQPGVDNPLRQ